jgi:hypothetical protein
MKTAQKTRRPQGTNSPSFESVWALIGESHKEIAQMIKESKKETDRLIKKSQKENAERQKENAERQRENAERQKEIDRLIKENAERQKETDRQMKEYNRRFGDFTNRFGEVVEYMIAPNLCDKFREFGFVFEKANSGTRVSDYTHDLHFEVDVMLENGDKAMLVEIKTKLTTEDVKEHIQRIEKMRKYADFHGDKRAFLGAAAGVVMTPSVKKYVLRQGLFAIEPSGETFNITPPNNQPREW